MSKDRARDLGLRFSGETGPWNAITDVAGVGVGMTTVIEDARDGVHRGLCTGVTAIVPRLDTVHLSPVWAGLHAFNGSGEMTGAHWIRDGGWFLGPVMLTNTHSVGMVHHGTTRWLVRRHADEMENTHSFLLPVVAETYDGVLNDINAFGLTEAHVAHALDTATSGPVAEGNTGGGAGMIAYEFKGGTGTASRRVTTNAGEFTVGVLVQANHGTRDWLEVSGIPIGHLMREDLLWGRDEGSIIVVIATDCPLTPTQLDRVARRATLGIARGGTRGGNSSGDIFLAFTTANAGPVPSQAGDVLTLSALNDHHITPVFEAAVNATEESVINAMLAANDRTAVRPEGIVVRAIDPERLLALLAEQGACVGSNSQL